MRVVVVGAGPTGLFLSIALARRGHRVSLLDADPGPRPDGSWPRRGVMQFHHPHAVRGQVHDALADELPEVLAALVERGARPVRREGVPFVLALQVRREVYEAVLRTAALREPGVSWVAARAEAVVAERDRAVGVRAAGGVVPADLVLDVTGRAGHLTTALRAPLERVDAGIAYCSRQHVLLPGRSPRIDGFAAEFVDADGYQAAVFPHEGGTFSTLLARAAGDDELAGVRAVEAYDAVCAAVPLLARWTSPDVSRPLTGVLLGGRLHNTWQGQRGEDGRAALPGLVCVGDTVLTTNPMGGRGLATGVLQARELLRLLDGDPDLEAVALALDAWCTAELRPWFDDHVRSDVDRTRRWAGGEVDLDRPLPSDLVGHAVAVDPSLLRVVGPYVAMVAPPSSLDAVQDRVREVYLSGWRPAADAPTRDDLAEVVRAAVPGQRVSARA